MRGFYGHVLGWIVWISFMPVSHGLAWGPQGHRIVGMIAEFHLEPEVRNRILREFNIKHLSHVANWADAVKRDRKATRSFHYTNIDDASDRYQQSRDCPRKACVTAKIKEYADQLQNRASPPKVRLEAFKFLVHLVADVHQPMHLGNSQDRGGNDIRVIFEGKPTNLHAVWDHGLIDRNGKTLLQYARFLNREVTPEQARKWTGGMPEDWTNESRALVLKHGYPISEDGRLTPQYIERGRRVVASQLQKAGVRLGDLLNRILQSK